MIENGIVKEVMEKAYWNNLVQEYAPSFGAFLQSWEWGEFQEQLGRDVRRIDHVGPEGRTIAQAIGMPLPLGQRYWYLPKGPLGKAVLTKQVTALREQLSDAVFLRMEPDAASDFLRIKDVQPAETLVLDLEKGEEGLLAEMKAKTRYNIRLAAKKGVECKIVGFEYFDDFIRLFEQTTQRDRFAGWPPQYYRTMLEVLKGEAHAYLAMAFYEGRPLVANLMIDFGDTRTYLVGSSSNLHRNVMAPYGLHWFLIQDAIAKGFKTFDFWGIAPEGVENHPLVGVTRYKKGYGGRVVEMPGTFDLPQKHLWYAAYKGMKRVRG